MLVLTRKQGQSIRVGDDVVITVVRIKGNQVRLGFEAPSEVVIDRAERAGTPGTRRPRTETDATAAG